MTVKELKDIVSDLNDDALVFIYADHGQNPYQAEFVNLTKQTENIDVYDGCDIDFNYFGEDKEDEEIDPKEITAILIS
jgi:phosphopentomutase